MMVVEGPTWRDLWRMPSPTDPDKYIFISLENGPDRFAFQVADDAPIAITARTYYDTLKKLEAMSRPAFDAFVAKWLPQAETLREKDAAKAEGFFAAITEVVVRLQQHEREQQELDTQYLFDEQEQP